MYAPKLLLFYALVFHRVVFCEVCGFTHILHAYAYKCVCVWVCAYVHIWTFVCLCLEITLLSRASLSYAAFLMICFTLRLFIRVLYFIFIFLFSHFLLFLYFIILMSFYYLICFYLCFTLSPLFAVQRRARSRHSMNNKFDCGAGGAVTTVREGWSAC